MHTRSGKRLAPIASSHATQPAVAQGEIPARSPGHVYIVADDEGLRRSIQRLLRAAGLQVGAYARATNFLEDAPDLPPGCIVVDLRGTDGPELVQRIRAVNLPFGAILMTAHADVSLAVRAMKAGANDFIEKPFADGVLL